MATAGNQHRGDTGPRQHSAYGATDSARTDDDVPAVACRAEYSNAIGREYVCRSGWGQTR